jgi:glycosyltransferase involved in cell wall biosynthesis
MRMSFVIPAYNEQELIGDCLRAVLARIAKTNFETEIIVVNNASTDRTAEVAAAFPGVKVIDEPRKGLSRARHTGFLASTGDLIANIDADTRLPDGWLEKAFRAFEQNPNLAALSGPFDYYDLSRTTNAGIRGFYHLAIGPLLQGGNIVARRTALEKIGGFNPQFTFYGEDVDIARRLSKVGEVKFDFNFRMPSSGRRLAAEGIFKMAVKYGLNYIWTLLFKKPFTKKVVNVTTANRH